MMSGYPIIQLQLTIHSFPCSIKLQQQRRHAQHITASMEKKKTGPSGGGEEAIGMGDSLPGLVRF